MCVCVCVCVRQLHDSSAVPAYSAWPCRNRSANGSDLADRQKHGHEPANTTAYLVTKYRTVWKSAKAQGQRCISDIAGTDTRS